jgi:hypothetical protein
MEPVEELDEYDALMVPLPATPPRRPLRRRGTEDRVATMLALAPPLVVILVLGLSRPGWTVPALAGTGAVLFAVWFRGGPSAWIRRRRVRVARRRHPREPWFWERAWDPKGESLSPFARSAMRKWLMGALLAMPVIALWLTATLTAGRRAWLLDALACAVTIALAVALWRLHGAGTTRVSFASFPFHPGERASFHVGTSDGGATFQRVEFHLRHVQEFPGGFADSTFRHHVTRDLVVSRPPGRLPGPDQDVIVSFDLPDDAPPTRLSARPPSYWVLDILANTTSGPFCESFLVPVYHRPREGPEDPGSA